MRHSAFDSLTPQTQLILACIVVGAAIIYALFRGKVFMFAQPTRRETPIMFYTMLAVLCGLLVLFLFRALSH